MTDKMKFSYGGLGAGVETEIVAPKIQNKCPKCNLQMDLVEGVGLINSDFHTLKAKCRNCGYSEEFSDYKLWATCIEITRPKFNDCKWEENNTNIWGQLC